MPVKRPQRQKKATTRAPTPPVKPRVRRGRPPLPPRTQLARWIRDKDWSIATLADRLRELAPKCGVDPDLMPPPKTLLDAVNGRHAPPIHVMLVVKYLTHDQVDLEHWHRDLSALR